MEAALDVFFNGFCLLYVKIWTLLVSWPVSFSWMPLSPDGISQAQRLLKLPLTLLESVALCYHIYWQCKAFTIQKMYLEAYSLLPCLDISIAGSVSGGLSLTVLTAPGLQGSSRCFWVECCLLLAMVLQWPISVHCKSSLQLDGKSYLVCGWIFFPHSA